MGNIKKIVKHPNADKLQLCNVDSGDGILDIVCGANNIKVGDNVPLAKIGAKLSQSEKLPNGLNIKKSKIREVESYGMLCSSSELGLGYEYDDGIFILPADLNPGELISKISDLNDFIIDISVTPNRGDCLSLYGLSRDLNIFYSQNSDIQIYSDSIPDTTINFSNNAKLDCPKISFLNIEIRGDISGYKDYLEKYFTDLGIPKNNFFTDVSNYIAYEMGQPTHSYDFKKISKELTLTDNLPNTTFTTLHGNKIELEKNELAFLNNSEVINLAGIMGGLNSCLLYTSDAADE